MEPTLPQSLDTADKPKVMLVIAQLSLGGAERQLMLTVQQLRHRYRFVVVAYDNLEHTDYADDLRALGAEVLIIKRRPGWTGKGRFMLELVKLMRATNPDVIHTWLVSANFWGLTAARLAGLKSRTIASIRNVKELDSDRLEKLLNRMLCRWSRIIISNTAAAKANMVKYGVPADLIKVIPNGIDITPYDTALLEPVRDVRAALGLPLDRTIIGTIGRLEEQKNHALFVAAAGRLRADYHNLHFVIVGEGRLRARLQSLIAENGLGDAVTLLGNRRDIPRILRALDVFVLTSDWEGFPNVVMEAMCARLPVIATDVGGVGELVRPDVSGLLVPAGDCQALASAVRKFVDEPVRARACADAARTYIESECTLERLAQKTAAEYGCIVDFTRLGRGVAVS